MTLVVIRQPGGTNRETTLEEVLATYWLYILDMNGTVSSTPFIDHEPLHVLPGRVEQCQYLREKERVLTIASNQGGVARGYLTEEEAQEEVAEIAAQVGAQDFIVAYGFEHPLPGYERYATEEYMQWRKPRPGMLLELMRRAGIGPERTLMVGDRYEDLKAAQAAGVDFISAIQFFGDEIVPTRNYAKEGTIVYPGYISPYEFHFGEKHF